MVKGMTSVDSNHSAVEVGAANSLGGVKQGLPEGFLLCDTNFPHLPCCKYFWLVFFFFFYQTVQ